MWHLSIVNISSTGVVSQVCNNLKYLHELDLYIYNIVSEGFQVNLGTKCGEKKAKKQCWFEFTNHRRNQEHFAFPTETLSV